MSFVIAYPGTAGSFSHGAAQAAFPDGTCVGFNTFPEAAKAVTEGRADYALLPVENSFAGAVLLLARTNRRTQAKCGGEKMPSRALFG